jgi:hypothetical protein
VGTRCIADVDSYFFGLRTASVAGLKSLWKFNQCQYIYAMRGAPRRNAALYRDVVTHDAHLGA